MKESINKSPKSAMAFYLKIYCLKQGKTNNKQNNLIEATKSWVSLSRNDKRYILNAFNEYKTTMKKRLASNLQNAELYMKKKHDNPKRLSKHKTTASDCNQPFEDTGINKENSYSLSCSKDEHEKDIQHNNLELGNYDTTNLLPTALHSVECVNKEPHVPNLISEPTPPIRSSMELFEIIKYNEESTRNVNWTDLTKLQKQRYQRALLSIKNDYLKKYTAYLEQLTPEELFHYYKSKS